MKNKKIYFIFSLIIFSGALIIFVYTLINHLIEIQTMNECANTPGCMYCLPKWVGGRAYINYFIVFMMLLVLIILFVKTRKINK